MAHETLALLQHGTRMYLLDVANLSRDMFYQQVLCVLLQCCCNVAGTLQFLNSQGWHG